MSLTYRKAKADDFIPAQRIYETAIYDLDKRHGFANQPVGPFPPNPFFAFSRKEEPERFWVAEDNDRVVGIALSWMRDSFWFLSYLFILPSYQGKGVGRALIDKTLGQGNKAKTTNRALITLAYNPVSISLYMRYSMYPREPLYWMSAPRETVRSTQLNVEPLKHEELRPTQRNVERLSHIDEHVLGFSLEKHHDFLTNIEGATCYLFRKDKVPEGYAYIGSNGNIGPLAVRSPSSLGGIMKSALDLAASKKTKAVSLTLAGSNTQAVSIALEHKMRIAGLFLLMSSRPFGNWASYLFHSPWLM